MTLHSFWTDDRDAIIRTVAANGGTAMEAFKATGAVSRNAVIGRANRLGVRFGQRGKDKVVEPIRLPSKPRPLAKVEMTAPKKRIIGRPWSEDEIATMRAMAAKRCTFAEVAEAIGRSKGAVECKASDCEVKFFRHQVPRPPKPFGGVSRAGRPVVFKAGGQVALVDLDRHHCRYIAGDPRAGGPIYCGDRREPGSSFCPAHHQLCYTPSQRYVTPRPVAITKVILRVLA